MRIEKRRCDASSSLHCLRKLYFQKGADWTLTAAAEEQLSTTFSPNCPPTVNVTRNVNLRDRDAVKGLVYFSSLIRNTSTFFQVPSWLFLSSALLTGLHYGGFNFVLQSSSSTTLTCAIMAAVRQRNTTPSGKTRSGRSPAPVAKPVTSAVKRKDYASDGVKDNDIFLLPASDFQLLGVLTLLASVVRLFRIYQPSSVVFDEVQ